VRVVVVAGHATLLIQSDALTIHVWRASRLFPNRNVP
jgi:hypothetical protein